jgi:hypothetical protein
VSAYEELDRDRRPGPETIALLKELTAQVTRTHSFPPRGYPRWTDEAVDEFVGRIFETGRADKMITGCFMRSVDQQSLERLLLTSIGNALKDEAKATPIGKLRRRLKTLLKADERFVSVPPKQYGGDAWTLPSSAGFWSGHPDELDRLTRNVDVEPIETLPASGPTPGAAKASLVELTYAALLRVAAAVLAQTLARFLAARFHLDTPTVLTGGADSETIDATPDSDVADLADDILAELTPRQRQLLGMGDDRASIMNQFGGDGADDFESAVRILRTYRQTELGHEAILEVLRRCGEEDND